MSVYSYTYELRRGQTVVATGHLTAERPFVPGESIEIGGRTGSVESVEPTLARGELRLIVRLEHGYGAA